MSTDTPRPERVTLSDEERAARQTLDAQNISHWLYHNSQMMPRECDELAAKILDSGWLAAREQALREAYDVAAGEWADDYADWMANNPGPSGIPSDPPMLATYLARGGAR